MSEEFKEVPLKEAIWVGIPTCLLPFIPTNPVVGHPMFLTERPRLFKLKNRLAITRDTLVWRDMNGWIWTVPAGFLTDGASVPWLLRWLWSPWDEKTLRPALPHDLRYCLHDYFENWEDYDSRTAADDSLYDGMMIDCPSRASVYHFACAMFGRAVYEHINKEAMMEDWFEVLRKDSKPELDKWILNVIEKDKAA
jgi:hypothetical protein